MDIPKLIDSISHIVWPLLAIVVLWRLFPTIVDLIKTRGIKVKIGDMEVSIQEASEQIRQQIEDLQKKVAEARTGFQATTVAPLPPPTAPAASTATPLPSSPAPPRARPHRVLWVDDSPTNNAFEIARLRDAGVEVIEARTTDEALRILKGTPVDVIITDMERREYRSRRSRAGLNLIEEARATGVAAPIFVYTSEEAVERTREEVLAAGGNGATASPVELFELLRDALGVAA